MGNYYFLAPSLPPLDIHAEPDISFEELSFLLKTNLSQKDYEKTLVLRTYTDLENLRNFFLKREIDPRGRLQKHDLEEAVLSKGNFPPFIIDWLEKHETNEDRLKYFSELWAYFFPYAIKSTEGFLKKYFMFERSLRLILTGFRAKKLKKDLGKELQYEDPYDTLVQQILAQKDAKTYEPPEEFQDLKAIFDENEKDPMSLYNAIEEFRFHKVDELVGLDEFSIDKILGYIVKLFIVENRQALNRDAGLEMLKQMEKG